MRRGTPQPISDVVKNVVEQITKAKNNALTTLAASWKTLAGKQLARHTRPVSLNNRMLRVLVDSSAWMYQANLEKERLLKQAQTKVGEKAVREICFRIGKTKDA